MHDLKLISDRSATADFGIFASELSEADVALLHALPALERLTAVPGDYLLQPLQRVTQLRMVFNEQWPGWPTLWTQLRSLGPLRPGASQAASIPTFPYLRQLILYDFPTKNAEIMASRLPALRRLHFRSKGLRGSEIRHFTQVVCLRIFDQTPGPLPFYAPLPARTHLNITFRKGAIDASAAFAEQLASVFVSLTDLEIGDYYTPLFKRLLPRCHITFNPQGSRASCWEMPSSECTLGC